MKMPFLQFDPPILSRVRRRECRHLLRIRLAIQSGVGIEIFHCGNNWKKGKLNYSATFQHLLRISTSLFCNKPKSPAEKSDKLSVIFLSFFTVFYISSSWFSLFTAYQFSPANAVVVVVLLLLSLLFLQSYARNSSITTSICGEATDV